MCYMGIIGTSEAMGQKLWDISTEIEIGMFAHDDFGVKVVLWLY